MSKTVNNFDRGHDEKINVCKSKRKGGDKISENRDYIVYYTE